MNYYVNTADRRTLNDALKLLVDLENWDAIKETKFHKRVSIESFRLNELIQKITHSTCIRQKKRKENKRVVPYGQNRIYINKGIKNAIDETTKVLAKHAETKEEKDLVLKFSSSFYSSYFLRPYHFPVIDQAIDILIKNKENESLISKLSAIKQLLVDRINYKKRPQEDRAFTETEVDYSNV